MDLKSRPGSAPAAVDGKAAGRVSGCMRRGLRDRTAETVWWEQEIRFRPQIAILTFLFAGLASANTAERHPIDTARSRVFVRVSTKGLFSVLARDHRIAAPIASGSVTLGDHPAVQLMIETRNLRVLDPEVPADTRQEIEETMLGPKVLNAARYPEIVFSSQHVTRTGQDDWRVRGRLTLHGQTHSLTLDVNETGGVYQGTVEIRQSDFGITPIRIAAGTVKVKDAVHIRFDLRLQASKQATARRTSRISQGRPQ